MTDDRRFNLPYAPYYGAARRAWKVMMEAFPDADAFDTAFQYEWGTTWDAMLVEELVLGSPEPAALRTVLYRALICYP